MSQESAIALGTRLSPYAKFKMALKSKEVQRQYPNLLGRFLDFCKFQGDTVEDKAIKFLEFSTSNSLAEVEDAIIGFILFQKKRIEQKEITAGTLRNYVKAIKLFCRMNRIGITWDVISSSLPKVKQYSNDRIPTVEEIKKIHHKQHKPSQNLMAVMWELCHK